MSLQVRDIAARAMGVGESEVQIRRSVPTHVNSEVVLLATSDGDVIAKQFLGAHADQRFEAELTALEVLGPITPTVARLRGVDRENLVLVTQALDGLAVEEVIRGTDRGLAVQQLVAYARAVGVFQDASRGCSAAIGAVREARGFAPSAFWPPFVRELEAASERLAALSDTPFDLLRREIAEVIERTFEPVEDGPLIHWDTWPGNAIALRDRVVLVDLENTMRGAGLVDLCSWHLAFPAAPLRLPFAAPLPEQVIAAMDRAYAHATGRPMTVDDLAYASASRMLFELTAPSAWKLTSGTLDDRVRALYMFRLMRAADYLQRAEVLATLAAAMLSVASKTRRATHTVEPLQMYPALLGTDS